MMIMEQEKVEGFLTYLRSQGLSDEDVHLWGDFMKMANYEQKKDLSDAALENPKNIAIITERMKDVLNQE